MSKNKKNSEHEDEILVVGIGASAGGLAVLKTFFSTLPAETGMAFIVIVHLAPEHESNMAELLQMQTQLQVSQVTEKVAIQPDHVYVIPPKKLLEVGDNHLTLSEPNREHGLATIDLFFRSLAKTKKGNAAGIILSGTGSDGTIGMKAVKEAGGLAIVQDPAKAEYPGMPQSAVDSGLADLVLPVQEMAGELLDYKENLGRIEIDDQEKENQKALKKIFQKVRSATEHDFTDYKRSSVLRRIKRRMQINRITALSQYVDYLNENPDEIDKLFKDLLISVTNFFRDPKAFKALENKIIPKLFENKEPDEQVRVWVPGCATGEEAYSVAMLLREYARSLDVPPEVKLFATDIDKRALNIARKRRYPQSIAADVSEERLDRHFNKEGGQYQIKKEIQDMILFAPHDLLRDPPFSKLDLVTCRNLLIYLNRELQSKVFNLFHYTLRDDGYLFLGLSDSNIEGSELFKTLDKKNHLYRRMPVSTSSRELPQTPLHFGKKHSTSNRTKHSSRQVLNFETLHRTLLSRLYAPESVIINDNFQVLHATDGIKKFLEYSGGKPSHSILEMLKKEIRQPLRSLLFQLEQEEQPQPLRNKVRLEDGPADIELVVHAIRESNYSDGLIQVVFKEIEKPYRTLPQSAPADKQERMDEDGEIIDTLEDELEYTKEQLQIAVEEYETSNEELRASNEELQSMNEELQSTTEELETSQEELQSVNEELKTVNRQLESKVEKLDRANSDLKNLMGNTEIGIMFVDRNLCVQRFTSTVSDIFNLIASDKGRPLEHVTHKLEYDSILDDIAQVLDRLQNMEKVVCSEDGSWYIMRLRPYRSTEDKIEGVVVSFVEFTELKEAKEVIHEQTYQHSLATLGVYALEQYDLEAIMKRAIDLSCIVLELDCVVILSLSEEKDRLSMGAHAGCAKESEAIDIDPKWDIGYAMNQKEATIVVDYKQEDRFTISPFMEDADITSSVNMVVRGSDEAFGLLGFYTNNQREFAEFELNYMQVVASIVGMAIEREANKKALKKEVKQSKQYQREILNSNIIERWELGSYLHDNLAQTLASVKILINDLNDKLPDDEDFGRSEITKINEVINEGIAGVRDLTHDIIPIDIEEEGVAHAFRYLMQQTQKIHQVNCNLETGDIIYEIRNIELATNIYHVIQEAVKNAVMHGKAENIFVSITQKEEHLQIQIKDDGKGISQTRDKNNGHGLRIMKYRMELLGGTFKIEDRSDTDEAGTLITCTVPLEYLMVES